MQADNTGGALGTAGQEGLPETTFTGTPTGFGRASGIVPMDYVSGTNVNFYVVLYSGNTNNQAMLFYIGVHTDGGSSSTWNVQLAQTSATINLSANVIKYFLLYTIPAASISAGATIAMAMQPNAAITGSIYNKAVFLEYTADS